MIVISLMEILGTFNIEDQALYAFQTNDGVPPLTKSEKSLNNNRSEGEYSILAELLKAAGAAFNAAPQRLR